LDLAGLGIDEQRDLAAIAAQFLDRMLHPGQVAGHIQTAFGCQLLAPLRHQAYVFRTDLTAEREHFVGNGDLQVHPRLHHFLEQPDVALLNMPTVLAQMHGNTIGARLLRLDGGLHRIRIAGPTGLTQGRHMIDIHTKQYTLRFSHCRSPLEDGGRRAKRLRLTSGRSPRCTPSAWRIRSLAVRSVPAALQSSAAIASNAAPDRPASGDTGWKRG